MTGSRQAPAGSAPRTRAAINTLVVEDEQIAAEAHAAYLGRLPAFAVVGVARSGREALTALGDRAVDLVLLDLNLPDGHGLDIVRRMRAAGHIADVVAVTAARELDVVRRAVNLGVVAYLLKPFSVATFSAKLEQYAAFRAQLAATEVTSQDDVDDLLGSLRVRSGGRLPAGLTAETLTAVRRLLLDAGRADRSASEVAAALGMSRVTARRYLEHLAESGAATREPRYGAPGRPSVGYRAGA